MAADHKPSDVAGRLRQLQAKHGLTIQEMADRCGLPKRSLENYMNLKEPQRPGVDALISIAEGLNVSIDWIVGRIDDSSGPNFSREDYAVFCQSAVLHILLKIIEAVKENPQGAVDADAHLIMGHEPHEIAAVAMLDFMAIAELQAGHSSRPKDYFKRHFASLKDMAMTRTHLASVGDTSERKL